MSLSVRTALGLGSFSTYLTDRGEGCIWTRRRFDGRSPSLLVPDAVSGTMLGTSIGLEKGQGTYRPVRLRQTRRLVHAKSGRERNVLDVESAAWDPAGEGHSALSLAA